MVKYKVKKDHYEYRNPVDKNGNPRKKQTFGHVQQINHAMKEKLGLAKTAHVVPEQDDDFEYRGQMVIGFDYVMYLLRKFPQC